MPPKRKDKKTKEARYHPFPKVPSVEEYRRDEHKWDSFLSKLRAVKRESETRSIAEDIKAEEAALKAETDAFVAAARDKSKWHRVDRIHGCDCDASCPRWDATTEQWLNQGTAGYRFQETPVFLCDQCWGNFDHVIHVESVEQALCEACPSNIFRVTDRNNWVAVPCANDGDNVCIEDIRCDLKDTCWYHGNTDRLNEYERSYRFKTTDLYLCDVCMDNGKNSSGEMEQLLEDSCNE